MFELDPNTLLTNNLHCMKYRSRNAAATLAGLCFVLFCFSYGHAGKVSKRGTATESQRKVADNLLGEWRVKCGTKIYKNGELLKSSQDQNESVVVIESDPDGSYELRKFPAGFGEGFPRLRKVSANQYAGDDTIRGITTSVLQTVDLADQGITIKQSVIDAPSKQPQADITCTGTRLESALRFPATNSAGEICQPATKPVSLPKRKLTVQYKAVRPFSDGLAAVATARDGGSLKWGFIDETGRIVIPMRYDIVTSFYGGLAAAGKFYGKGQNLKWTVVEKLGPQVTAHVNYDAVKILGEGFAALGYAVPDPPGVRWNLINRENTTIFHGFDEIGCFVGGRARASYTENNVVRKGYVNKVGDFFSDK